jgi:lipopolysaccharide transport system permease protein
VSGFAEGLRSRRRRTARVVHARGAWDLRLFDLWAFRALVPRFGKVYVERRYRRTWLGWLWIPLRPGIDVASRVLLFGGLLGVAPGDRPYFMFFVVGAGAWQLFQTTALWATRSLEINRGILDRVAVPRATAVLGAVVAGLVDLLLYATIGGIAALYYKLSHGTTYITVAPTTSLAFAGIILLALYAVAVGFFTAPLALKARDVRFVLMYALGFWYLVTPIIYPTSYIPEKYRPIAEFNPLSAPVEFVKYGLLDTSPPSGASVVVSLSVLVVLLVGGYLSFQRREARAQELI